MGPQIGIIAIFLDKTEQTQKHPVRSQEKYDIAEPCDQFVAGQHEYDICGQRDADGKKELCQNLGIALLL